MKEMHQKNNGGKAKGFTFTEVMITMSLFVILGGIGVGSYFHYYRYSLMNNDLSRVTKVLHETRFRAMKNPYNADYGVHLNGAGNELIMFHGSYSAGHPENFVTKLDHLNISELNLMPEPGNTRHIIFEKKSGKTPNHGSFKVGRDEYSYTFTINEQGAFE